MMQFVLRDLQNCDLEYLTNGTVLRAQQWEVMLLVSHEKVMCNNEKSHGGKILNTFI